MIPITGPPWPDLGGENLCMIFVCCTILFGIGGDMVPVLNVQSADPFLNLFSAPEVISQVREVVAGQAVSYHVLE